MTRAEWVGGAGHLVTINWPLIGLDSVSLNGRWLTPSSSWAPEALSAVCSLKGGPLSKCLSGKCPARPLFLTWHIGELAPPDPTRSTTASAVSPSMSELRAGAPSSGQRENLQPHGDNMTISWRSTLDQIRREYNCSLSAFNLISDSKWTLVSLREL